MKRPVLSSKQYGAAQRVGYTTDDLGFKSWQEQKTYLFSKTSRPAPAPTQPPNPVLSQAVKWPVQTVRPLPPTAKFINQWSYTSTQPVGFYDTYCYNFISHPIYLHLSQEVTPF